jgi:hypothetical protein
MGYRTQRKGILKPNTVNREILCPVCQKSYSCRKLYLRHIAIIHKMELKDNSNSFNLPSDPLDLNSIVVYAKQVAIQEQNTMLIVEKCII